MNKLRLLLGTKNQGKVEEAKSLLSLPGRPIKLLTFREKDFASVEEDGETYAANSLKKAKNLKEQTGLPVLADDSGLEVLALGGQPGVRSARFAGKGSSDEENLKLLLKEMEGIEDRRARFVTVATLYLSSSERYMTRGELVGRIAHQPSGDSGFGYDPVFVPEGFENTLAQMSRTEKNEISHRRKALEKIRDKLVSHVGDCS